MKMTINQNTINNRIEITFSEKPSAEIRTAIQENAHFVYRNIGGKLMWLCTARYFNRDDYNGFIKTYCQDFEKTILKDGKAVKKTTAKKTTSKKTTAKAKAEVKTETQDDAIAELQAQMGTVLKAMQTLMESQTTHADALQMLLDMAKETKKTEAKAEPIVEVETPKKRANKTMTGKAQIVKNGNKKEVVLMVNGRVVR